MTDERLNEINDSINLQLDVCKSIGVNDEIVLEEKELYDKVVRLKKEIERLNNIIDELEKYLNEELKNYTIEIENKNK